MADKEDVQQPSSDPRLQNQSVEDPVPTDKIVSTPEQANTAPSEDDKE